MLSYRHSFHAGNFADVIKHIVLVEMLDYLIKKEAPFEYIDTHAGAGLYNLKSADAQKLQEYTGGIGKLEAKDFPELTQYFAAIQSFNRSAVIKFYPGSPCIAQFFLRPQDRAWLFELHPRDYDVLCDNMQNHKKTKVECQDGFQGLNALLPPISRRGLILIDPSYEIKTDYDLVATQLINAYKKFSQGVFAVWYPVVDRAVVDRLERKIIKSGIKNIQRFELGVRSDTEGRGMTSAGMIVINPPWTLFDKMASLLPKLAQQLGENNKGCFKCDVLAPQ